MFCDLVTSTEERVRVGEDAADRIVLEVLAVAARSSIAGVRW